MMMTRNTGDTMPMLDEATTGKGIRRIARDTRVGLVFVEFTGVHDTRYLKTTKSELTSQSDDLADVGVAVRVFDGASLGYDADRVAFVDRGMGRN